MCLDVGEVAPSPVAITCRTRMANAEVLLMVAKMAVRLAASGTAGE